MSQMNFIPKKPDVVKAALIFGIAVLIVCVTYLSMFSLASANLQSPKGSFVVNDFSDAVDANIGDGLCGTAGGVCTLRAAIQEANSQSDHNLIELAAGTYLIELAGALEDAGGTGDFDLLNPVTISGQDQAETIIDAQENDRVFHNLSSATLQNLTVQKGFQPEESQFSAPASVGSGIRNEGTLILNEVTIRKSGESGITGAGYGLGSIGHTTVQNSIIEENAGGIFIDTNSTLKVVGSVIQKNVASFYGGGISTDHSGDPNEKIFIADSQIIDNVSTSSEGGGGIYIRTGRFTIVNSLISRNVLEFANVSHGGGVYIGGSADGIIKDSEISENVVYDIHGWGGGVALNYGELTIDSSLIMDNHVVSGFNRDEKGGYGGGAQNFQGTMRIKNSSIISNSAYFGGGLHNTIRETMVANTTIARNSAVDGGGVHNDVFKPIPENELTWVESAMVLSNVTIVENTADRAGGGIWNDTQLYLSHVVASENTAQTGADCEIEREAGPLTSFGYNLITNGGNCEMRGDATGNQIGVAAQLTPFETSEASLAFYMPDSGSPLIDAGSADGCVTYQLVEKSIDEGASSLLIFDQLGRWRIADGDSRGEAVCDIGAVEFGSTLPVFEHLLLLPIMLIGE